MWEEFYDFLEFLTYKTKRYPFDLYFTIEMDKDLYNFTRDIGFMPENGIFKFKGTTFVLG